MKSLELTYPFGKDWTPDQGATKKVAEGVYWLRMPLPFKLDHINLWLLEDGDGWTVVDTCVDVPQSQTLWRRLFAGLMAGKPVKRVLVTHMHPDHVGLAGWLTREFDCQLWMSRKEFTTCRRLVKDTGQQAPDVAIRFYRAAGYDEQQLDSYRQRFGNFGTAVSPLPEDYQCLTDQQEIQIGQYQWRIVVGSGHSPEHCTLFCEELNLLLSGDQVIPRISSNVSVFPEGEAIDPLTDWLNSCRKLKAELPEGALVLPAHQEPFYGLHSRLDRLVEGHERALERLLDLLAKPHKAVDCFRPLFRSKITAEVFQFATGEALSHLHCLEGRGLILRDTDENGVDWYQRV